MLSSYMQALRASVVRCYSFSDRFHEKSVLVKLIEFMYSDPSRKEDILGHLRFLRYVVESEKCWSLKLGG